MPKISEEQREARRQEIVAAAQRCFAKHGYEGATVVRLEEETGLSRGAIFNYFASKQALFVAVAIASSDRFVEIWLEHGFRALLEAIAHEDPDWLAVQIESGRRVRTDPVFREAVARATAARRETRDERYERLRRHGSLRDDIPIETVVAFLSLIANGLAFERIGDADLPDLDALMLLVESGVAPR
ncbi:MAG: TetR/AcrR family transcriptional regulator [Actinomycetota bacterium]|nr:TetR/AcrR family transcriptional regulator [Actinomycetota bacterium]